VAFFIVSDQGSLVIDVEGNIAKDRQPLDVYTQKKKGDKNIDNQLWTLEQPPDNQQAPYLYQGQYFIQSKLKTKEGNALVIGIKDDSTTPGAAVEIKTKAPSQNGVLLDQLWYFMPGPNGYCFIASSLAAVNSAPPIVIDIKAGNTNPGPRTPLQIDSPQTSQSPGGNDYQLWKFVDENGNSVPIPAPPPQSTGGWPAPPGSDGGNPHL
jgi:DNA polymerase IIIc chi subunit